MIDGIKCEIKEAFERAEAFESAGWRERYAITHGKRNIVFIRGHKCWKFTYSPTDEYQDANGAIYDTVTKTWIN